MKGYWKEEVQTWKVDNDQCSLPKTQFASVFEKSLKRVDISVIVNGFRKCGLYAFDQNALEYRKLIANEIDDDEEESSVVNRSVLE